MKPYAYSLTYDYGDHHSVYPTLDKLVAYLKSEGRTPQPKLEAAWIYGHLEDGTKESVEDISAYLIVNEVNESEVAAYIDDLRETARKRDQEGHEKMIAEGRQPILVTGCCPVYMMDRERQIQHEIARRRYSWK